MQVFAPQSPSTPRRPTNMDSSYNNGSGSGNPVRSPHHSSRGSIRTPRIRPSTLAQDIISHAALTVPPEPNIRISTDSYGGAWGQRGQSSMAVKGSIHDDEFESKDQSATPSPRVHTLRSPSEEYSKPMWGRALVQYGPASSGVIIARTRLAGMEGYDAAREAEAMEEGGNGINNITRTLPPLKQQLLSAAGLGALPLMQVAATASSFASVPSRSTSLASTYSMRPTTSTGAISSRASAFTSQILRQHCDKAVHAAFDSAEGTIASLRLEVDILRRANDALRNPGRRTDGETVITPYAFSEENFLALYLENQRCKELLQANVARFDALTADHKQISFDLLEAKSHISHLESTQVEERLARAALEQKEANQSYQLAQEKRKLEACQTRLSAVELDLTEQKNRALHAEDEVVQYGLSLERITSERNAFEKELMECQNELRTLHTQHETLSTHSAALEGMLAASTSNLTSTRNELSRTKEDRANDASTITSVEEQLRTLQIALLKTEGVLERCRAEKESLEIQSSRASHEHSKLLSIQDEKISKMNEALAAAREAQENAVNAVRIELESERNIRKSESEKIEDRINAVRKEGESAIEAQTNYIKEIEKLTRQIAAQASSQKGLKDALFGTRAQITALTKELSAVRISEREAKDALALLQTQSAMVHALPAGESPHALASSLREARSALDQLRKTHASCSSRIALAEREIEKESTLRKLENRAAIENKNKLEKKLATLEARIGATAAAAISGHGTTIVADVDV
jgi:hypothetical protein